jgi:hypothetical protein
MPPPIFPFIFSFLLFSFLITIEFADFRAQFQLNLEHCSFDCLLLMMVQNWSYRYPIFHPSYPHTSHHHHLHFVIHLFTLPPSCLPNHSVLQFHRFYNYHLPFFWQLQQLPRKYSHFSLNYPYLLHLHQI